MLISGTPGYDCVSTFNTVEDALVGADDDKPDVLLLDIHLPGMLGSDGVRLLQQKYSTVQIVMLTVYAEEDKVFESICNGACGYLLKRDASSPAAGSYQRGARWRVADVTGDCTENS